MDQTAERAIPRHAGPLPRRGSRPLRLRVNGCAVTLHDDSATTSLLQALREELGLTGAKQGCRDGACGACTVLVDGRPQRACRIAIGEARDTDILTIEGLAAEPDNRVLAAFAADEALGCGRCWPGRVLAAAALLANHWRPSDVEIDEAMNAVSCLCGAGPGVGRAIRRAAGFPPG
jgi:aerobic-type carbon monoxide dehydrogenase small subunit (CoxS/CutS family)